MRRLFFWGTFLLLYFVPWGVHAQPQLLDASQQKLFSDLFSNPDLFTSRDSTATHSLTNDFLTLNARFITLMTTESDKWNEPFHSLADELIDTLTNSTHPPTYWSYLIASQTALYQALAYWHFDNKWKAIFKLREARKCFNQQMEAYPDYSANKKMEALFDILLGSIPADYKRFAGWLGFRGNQEKGWQQLSQYGNEVENHPGWHEEWLMWTGFIALKLNLEPPVYTPNQDILIQQTPILAFLAGWKALKQHQLPRSLFLTQKLRPNFPLLYYVRGMALLSQLRTEPALECFDFFRKNYPGPSYQADALKRCAWISLLEGNDSKAQRLRQEVTLLAAPSSMDQEAVRACSQEPLPNKELLKARLLFDGGSYPQGLALLRDLDTALLNTEENIEYHYRMGRLFMANSQPGEAIPHLEKAYQRGHETSSGYHAMYAALELARYYKGHNQPDQANRWIENCLECNQGPYKQDVRQQISRL